MNNNYYKNGYINTNSSPMYPGGNNMMPNQNSNKDKLDYGEVLNTNLEKNTGKKINVYTTFPGSNEWPNKIFSGILEYVMIDHLALSDPKTGKWYAIPSVYINYVEFEEAINVN